jgi:hypothetical protein
MSFNDFRLWLVVGALTLLAVVLDLMAAHAKYPAGDRSNGSK